MRHVVRDGSGAVLVACALCGFFLAVVEIRERDYVAALLLLATGLALVRAGVELLAPTVGE